VEVEREVLDLVVGVKVTNEKFKNGFICGILYATHINVNYPL